MRAPFDAIARLSNLRPEQWRDDLLDGVLWVVVLLGAAVGVPSIVLALHEGLYFVAIGDIVAVLALVGLIGIRKVGFRVRALGLVTILYLLGTMLLVFIGPVSEIYLLGFSVLTTLLLGLRAGMITVAINAATLGVVGQAGLAAPAFDAPGLHGAGNGGWLVVSLNFLLIDASLALALGAVLRTLESGLSREAAAHVSLQHSEALLRMASKVGGMGAWSLALPSRTLRWSDETRVVLGITDGAAPDVERAIDFYLPQDRPRVREAIEHCAREGVSFDLEAQIETGAGERRWVRAIAQALRDDDGAIAGVGGTIQDISERKAAEHAQLAAEARLREQAELLEKAQDAILVRDLDGRIRFMNQRAESLYGWDREQAIGQDARALQFANDPELFERANAATIEHGTWTGEMTQTTHGGSVVLVEARWTLLRRKDGEPYGVLAINTDITERKRLEQNLLRAQRLESIGTLAGGIAHDLNNVLTPILTAIAFLREGESDAEKLHDLEILARAADRGADMVRQLLLFARGDRARARVVVDMASIAGDVLTMVRDTFPKDITATMSTGRDVRPVRADPTQLHQLLTNLCVNARDAMPGGGTIHIGIEELVIDELYAGMTAESKPGPYVLVRVEDTGSGMSAELQERIFEPFFTTKEIGKGTGLGLSTCHTIVRSLGGFIHVYSEPGHGTRFKIFLPADVSGARAEATADASPLPRGHGELVLIVDDEAAIRSITARTLERYGYRTLVADNGATAVAVFAEHGREIALVLTDMSMPVMDGPATILALTAMDPAVKIIGSSGFEPNEKVSKSLGGRVGSFLAKPYTAQALLQEIRRLLDAPRPVPRA